MRAVITLRLRQIIACGYRELHGRPGVGTGHLHRGEGRERFGGAGVVTARGCAPHHPADGPPPRIDAENKKVRRAPARISRAGVAPRRLAGLALALHLMSRAQLRELTALFVIGSALTVAVFFLALWLLPDQPFTAFPFPRFP